uniref:Reverse transcriptase domain-containing protein n=1 Tax=Schistocephalus solidus TaxID=70667 RepID=A0A0X3PKZ8_SCHSO
MTINNVSAKIIVMNKAYYGATTTRVLARNNLSKPLNIRSGVRQGCILLPILLSYDSDFILEKAMHGEDGVELASRRQLNDLDQADNIAMLVSKFSDLQCMASRVSEVPKWNALVINAGKTTVFSSYISGQEKTLLENNGFHPEKVYKVKHLEARLILNGQSKDEIFSRIYAACRFFNHRKCI